ncbi:integrin, alpha 11, partial [Cichlidogyrus casuarinus]
MVLNWLIILSVIALAQQLLAEERLLDQTSWSEVLQTEFQRSKEMFQPVSPDRGFDSNLMHPCDTQPFKTFDPLSQISYSNSNKFRWKSVRLFGHELTRKSFILLGGAQLPLQQNGRQIIPENPAVVLCPLKLTPGVNIGFQPDTQGCQQLPKANSSYTHFYLGAAIDSITLSGKMAVILYCDPFWHDPTAEEKSNQAPVGRCFVNIVQDGILKESKEINSLCDRGESCLAGFSAHLEASKFSEDVKKLKIWIGAPLFQNKGAVKLVLEPYSEQLIIHSKDPGEEVTNGYFGYQVVPFYASTLAHTDVQNIKPLSGLDLYASAYGAHRDWFGKIGSDDHMQGFGTSLIKTQLRPQNQVEILVVGAPYTSSKGSNSGRIYLYCVKRDTLISGQLYDDYLDHSANGSYFGYALADLSSKSQNLIAVGAPFFGSNQGQVLLIQIYPNCTFDRRPKQTIQHSSPGFGEVLPKVAYDLDFNNQPDLAIPLSNLVHFYAARKSYKANCKFSVPVWLATRKIDKNMQIPIKVTARIYQESSDNRDILQFVDISTFSDQLVHQINPDSRKNHPSEQRFKIKDTPKVTRLSTSFQVDFILTPLENVETMEGIDTGENPAQISYRFLNTCPGGQSRDSNG